MLSLSLSLPLFASGWDTHRPHLILLAAVVLHTMAMPAARHEQPAVQRQHDARDALADQRAAGLQRRHQRGHWAAAAAAWGLQGSVSVSRACVPACCTFCGELLRQQTR